MTELICTKCREVKPVAAFQRASRYQSSRNGYTHYCTQCMGDYRRAYYRKNHPKHRQLLTALKNWRLRRFFYVRALEVNRVRRGQLGGEKGVVTALQLAAIWKRQRGLCALTGLPLRPDRKVFNPRSVHLDHIVPVIRGGDSSLSNLRWVLGVANQMKLAKLDSEFLDLCKAVVRTLEGSQEPHVKMVCRTASEE